MLNIKYKKYSRLGCFILNVFVALGIVVKKLCWVINKYINIVFYVSCVSCHKRYEPM